MSIPEVLSIRLPHLCGTFRWLTPASQSLDGWKTDRMKYFIQHEVKLSKCIYLSTRSKEISGFDVKLEHFLESEFLQYFNILLLKTKFVIKSQMSQICTHFNILTKKKSLVQLYILMSLNEKLSKNKNLLQNCKFHKISTFCRTNRISVLKLQLYDLKKKLRFVTFWPKIFWLFFSLLWQKLQMTKSHEMFLQYKSEMLKNCNLL